ncbi:tyrosine-protein kinase receptor Tie-1-like isoform X2 [Amphiura filiformis]|uniref:tyrosine-protein kinase receptor Tie-1-like isoform X2 n=1 Tax=Amphiura filiformis TaxID=82378 RepID=UPI003B212271
MITLKNLEPATTYQITIRANKESDELNGMQATISVTTKGSSSSTPIWAGTVGGVVALIIIIVLVIILCKVTRQRSETPNSPIFYVNKTEECSPSNTIDTLPPGEYENLRDGATDPLAWEIQRENIQILDKILGEGSFGVVQEGEVRIGNSWITVAVKSLPDGAGEREVKNFENELAIMKKIGRHINIVSLVGACRLGDMLYVALEHVSLGNLKNFLKESRTSISSDYADEAVNMLTNLSHAQLISLALDVAKGMQHLADRGIIHRDLAARNILVGQSFDGLVAKVCDFGMSRGDSIYRQSSNARVPVKWTAIEALTRQIFTTKSDVWSFGILLWEIVTLGGTPYTNPKIGNRDLPLYLQNNHRLAKPQNCDETMYDLMCRCWAGRPADRPTFAQLVRELTYILDDEKVYVITSIRGVDNFRFVNIDPDDD